MDNEEELFTRGVLRKKSGIVERRQCWSAKIDDAKLKVKKNIKKYERQIVLYTDKDNLFGCKGVLNKSFSGFKTGPKFKFQRRNLQSA